MTVKKITVEGLKAMVKEAVALQVKQTAAERRKKIADDKEKANKKKTNESKTVRVTVEQLRSLVKEAVRQRLSENMDMPQPGDLVAFKGRTGYVEDVTADGKIAVTTDGMRMQLLDPSEVQVLGTTDDLADLSPDELGGIDSEMGMNVNQDPGEDPQSEYDRITSQLDNKLLSKNSRNPLSQRQDTLKKQLGITDY